MGRFSNHCNNRFRGAFKHAVNQSVKEYEKNKQYESAESSQGISDGVLFLSFFCLFIFVYGNITLFLGGQNRYLFKDSSLLVLLAILTGIADVCIICFATIKICQKILSEKSAKIMGIIISIVLISVLICFLVYSYLPRCYFCDKLLLNNHEFFENFKLCENCKS